nr:hypothetical protein [Tanacetum cinerariifolium]
MNYAHRGTHKQNASFTHHPPQIHMVPAAVLTQSKPISTVVRPICAAVPKIMVTRPRHAHSIDTKSKSTFRRHITRGQSPKIGNSTPRVTAAQAPVVSAAKVIFMDTAYGSKGIRRIGNWSNAFSCEVQALIRRIFLVGYGVLVRLQ